MDGQPCRSHQRELTLTPAGSLAGGDAAVNGANYALVLVDQLRVTLKAIDRFDAQIAEIAPTLPDYALFKSFPGAGTHLTPRLLVAFGEQRERFATAAEIQKYSGVAPVTERSGNKC